MEIEKISDDQIKFILTQADLEERDIRISELSYGSEKSQELFHEIMEEAVLHCDFRTDGHVPLVVEAVPLAGNSLMIIVTKASDKDVLHSRFDILPHTKNEGKFIEKGLPEPAEAPAAAAKADKTVVIYVFDTLDCASAAALRIQKVYSGTGTLVKSFDGLYLILDGAELPGKETPALEYAIGDYGRKHSTSMMAAMYLLEHGDVWIRGDAVTRLASL